MGISHERTTGGVLQVDLAHREVLPELMDDAGLDAAEHERALSVLAASTGGAAVRAFSGL